MAKDFESTLKSLRQKASQAEREKVQLETRKEEAVKRKAELEKKCENLGINPADIQQEVQKLEKELTTILAKVENFFPETADVF